MYILRIHRILYFSFPISDKSAIYDESAHWSYESFANLIPNVDLHQGNPTEYGAHEKESAKVKHLIWFKWNQNNYIVLGPDSQKPFVHYTGVDGKQDNSKSTQSHPHPHHKTEINQHKIWRTKYFPNILMDQALSVPNIHIHEHIRVHLSTTNIFDAIF